MGLSAPHDPYGSPGRSPGRTTRPDDISGFHTRRTDDVRDAMVEDMRRTASLVEEQMGALKAIIDRATAAGSATDLALKARQSLEAEWWDAKESAEDTKLISYQKADAYIKRACTRMSGQRKWIASSNKNAGKTLDESLEELRLASLVLQQKHEEEAHASETLAKTSVELTGSVRAEHHAMSRLRSDLEPAVVAIVASMEELRSNLTRAAAAQARRAAEMPPTPAPPPRFPPATDVPVIPQIVHTFVEKPGLAAPDPELLDELRRQRERADDAALSLQRSQNAAQQDQANLLEEMSKLREKLGREAATAAVLKAEAEKWRAMYDAAGGAGRANGALDANAADRVPRAELEAMRDAARRAEERHRRELDALGAEHGDAHAQLRRALAAAERRVADLEPAAESAERRARSMEDQARTERARKHELEEEIARLRSDLNRRGAKSTSEERDATREVERLRDALDAAGRRAERLEEDLRKHRSEKPPPAPAAAPATAGPDAAARPRRESSSSQGGEGGWRAAAAESELKKALEELRGAKASIADLESALATAKKQLELARSTAEQAATSDLPAVVLRLEAELKKAKALHESETASLREIADAEARRVANLHRSELRNAADEAEAEKERAERQIARQREKIEQLESDAEALRKRQKTSGAETEAEWAAKLEEARRAGADAVERARREADETKRRYAAAAEDLANEIDRLKRERQSAIDAHAEDAARLRAEHKKAVDELAGVIDALNLEVDAYKKKQRAKGAEAAEEVERLSAEVERLAKILERERNAAKEETTAHEAERERLTNALERERAAASERARGLEEALATQKMKLATLRWRLLGGPSKAAPAPPEPPPPPPPPPPTPPDPKLYQQIEEQSRRIGGLEAELAAANKTAEALGAELEAKKRELDAANREAEAASSHAAQAADQAADAHRRAERAAEEAELAKRSAADANDKLADARRLASPPPPPPPPPPQPLEVAVARPRTPAPPAPPPEYPAGSAAYYQKRYATCADDLAVLCLLVQEAAATHAWPERRGSAAGGPGSDARAAAFGIRFGQRPGPMARAAGKLACRLLHPRLVSATWWEHLMFVLAAWFACVLAFACAEDETLVEYPAVALSPLIPSTVCLTVRIASSLPLDPKTDAPRFVLDVFHLACVPLGFILLFCKLWNDAGEIPWWVVVLFPFFALTRHALETASDVAFAAPRREYDALGYGAEGTAFEFAFSEPNPEDSDEEIDLTAATPGREAREPEAWEPEAREPEAENDTTFERSKPPRSGAAAARTGALERSPRASLSLASPAGPGLNLSRGGSFGAALTRSGGSGEVPRPGDNHTVRVDGVQFTNIESPPEARR